MPPFAQVVVVGSIMQDLTFACAEFPRAGQTVMARLNSGQGGKGSNQAIACGRAGARTLFVGAMGRGAYADQVADFYRREGIGCHLALKEGIPTGTAVILLDREGQNEIVIEPGANAALAATDVPQAALRQAHVVMVQLEANIAATGQVLRAARHAGATTILNPAPMRPDFPVSLLRHTDILIPNETEFIALVQRLPGSRVKLDEARLRAMRGPVLHVLCRRFRVPTVIITLGRRGCFVSTPERHFAVPAYRRVRVVDTTGAGDAFCGGFAAGLVSSRGDITESVRLGTAVAALSVTKPGAAGAMPTKHEIRRFRRQYD